VKDYENLFAVGKLVKAKILRYNILLFIIHHNCIILSYSLLQMNVILI